MMRSLLLLSFLLIISPIGAVTPNIRLPDWHKLDLQLKPGTKGGVFNLIVRVQALLSDVRDLSVSMRVPNGAATLPTTHTLKLLKAGGTWDATFEAQIAPGVSGWIDVAAEARPDITQLEQWLSGIATLTDASRLILREEIRLFTEPAQIGRTFPITVTSDCAVLMPREFLFQPLPFGKSDQLFVWVPDGEFSIPAPKRTLRDLRLLLQRKEWGKAAASARALLEAVQGSSELTFVAADQRRMTLSKELLIGCILVSIQALEALTGNQDEAIKEMVRLSEEPMTRPHTAFLWANLGALQAANGNPEDARKATAKALGLIPGWKSLQNRMNSTRSGGSK